MKKELQLGKTNCLKCPNKGVSGHFMFNSDETVYPGYPQGVAQPHSYKGGEDSIAFRCVHNGKRRSLHAVWGALDPQPVGHEHVVIVVQELGPKDGICSKELQS